MRSRSEHDARKETQASRELAVLSEVSQTPDMTQRELANSLGLSLGVTNLLLHTLIRKGYLRMRRAGWRRWLYALTPSGMTRKLSLTTAYVSRFLGQYRQVRDYLGEQLDLTALDGGRRIAVYGVGDMVRLVHLVLSEMGIKDVDVYVPDSQLGDLPGLDAFGLSQLSPDSYEHFVIAAIDDADERCGELRAAQVPADRMRVLFNLSRGTLGRDARLVRSKGEATRRAWGRVRACFLPGGKLRPRDRCAEAGAADLGAAVPGVRLRPR